MTVLRYMHRALFTQLLRAALLYAHVMTSTAARSVTFANWRFKIQAEQPPVMTHTDSPPMFMPAH